MKIKIEKIKIKDVKEYSILAKRTIKETKYYSEIARKTEIKKFNEIKIKKDLKNKNILFLSLKNKNEIIGFIKLNFEAQICWIDWIGIKKEYRHLGLADDLLKYLETKIKKNVHKIWCDTLTNNKESINLLKNNNYKKICLLKNHWYNLDFYLWEKKLK